MTNKTSTWTRRATRTELRKAVREAHLTPREEQVLRMRLGLTEDATPEFRGQDQPEVATKLARLEAEALRRVRPPSPVSQSDADGEARKRAIVEKLRKI
ncbi:MAG: hypothetical protein ACQEXJ_10800 [Myxococcota bacterium]